MWAENLVELSNHELPVVRRNLVPSLREYFETFPDDTRKLLPVMWQDGDEVVRTRMRELLIKMSDISSTQFGAHHRSKSTWRDLSALWRLMDARRKGSSEAWKSWLSGEGQMPETIETMRHVSTMRL